MRVLKMYTGMLGAVCFLGMAGAAQAATFSGSVVGDFSCNSGQPLPDYTYLYNNDADATATGYTGEGGQSEFAWGFTDVYERWGRLYAGDTENHSVNDRSYFAFQGVGSDTTAPSAFSVEDGQVFSIGDFTYRNTPVYGATDVDELNFSVDVTVTLPIGVSETFNIGLMIINTPNDDPDPNDYAAVTGMSGELIFDYEGATYQMEMLGFWLDGQYKMETYAEEGETQMAEIHARFNQVAVPLPAAAWLLGSGLLGLLPFRKKK